MPTAHARQAAILVARQKIALKPIYLDTETTGLGPDAEIVDICLLEHDGSVLPARPVTWPTGAKCRPQDEGRPLDEGLAQRPAS